MLAHKVDGEHPASYSNLHLAAQKLERWAEAHRPFTIKDSLQLVDLMWCILRQQGIHFPYA